MKLYKAYVGERLFGVIQKTSYNHGRWILLTPYGFENSWTDIYNNSKLEKLRGKYTYITTTESIEHGAVTGPWKFEEV